MCCSIDKEESFESALEKLERIVGDLENGDIDLAGLLEKYTQGVLLSKYCLAQLDGAEKAMDLVLKEKNGKVEEVVADIDGEGWEC